MLSNQELVEPICTSLGLVDMMKSAILNGSLKDGLGAGLCAAKLLFYLPLSDVYEIFDKETIEQLISYIDEDDYLYLENFLEGLLKVLQNEISQNPDEKLFYDSLSSSGSISRIEEIS